MPPDHEVATEAIGLLTGDEDAIRVAARAAAEAWGAAYMMPVMHAAAQREPWIRAERMCQRWQLRRLRRLVLRGQAYIDIALRMADPNSPAVSAYTLDAWRDRQARQYEWAVKQAIQMESGKLIPLTEIIATGRTAREAQLYSVNKAMEHHGTTLGHTALFLTITLPGQYHSVSSGERAPDGSYPQRRDNPEWSNAYGPAAGHAEHTRIWELLRAGLAKHEELRAYFGIIVPEPHKNGTEHNHALLYLPPTFQAGGLERNTALEVSRMLRRLCPGERRIKVEVIRRRAERPYASPASYVMKYILKAVDGERGEAHDRHRAWASARGIRRMRLLGVHGGLRIWQRIWTADAKEPLPPRAARVRDAMQRSRAAGVAARDTGLTDAERADARTRQSAAAAEALILIGALPGGDGRLRLEYEETRTEYGRASKKPVAVTEHEATDEVDDRGRTATRWLPTGNTFPLRLHKCTLVDLPKDTATPTAGAEMVPAQEKVTVAASYPRAGAAPRPDPVAADLDTLIQSRGELPQWQEWLPEARRRLDRLLGRPPDRPGGLRRPMITRPTALDVTA